MIFTQFAIVMTSKLYAMSDDGNGTGRSLLVAYSLVNWCGFFSSISCALSRDDLLDIFGTRMSLDNQVNQTKRHNDEPFCRCDKTAHTTTHKHFVLHAVWCKSAHRLCAPRKTSCKYTQSLIKSKIQIKFHCNGTTVCTWLTNEFYIFTSESSL